VLGALNEKERFQPFSIPFAKGAQQWVDSVFINSEKAGVVGDFGNPPVNGSEGAAIGNVHAMENHR
jgi:hypothetical protein